jgi:uncharacterized protein YdaU (DUF1376 family)
VWVRALGALARWERDRRKLNFYTHHIGDYLKDTSHLSALEDGIYRRMLDLYYVSEKPLPLNIEGLCRLVRAKTREEKKAVDTVLEEFFVRCDVGWRQSRADRELLKAQEKSGKAKASANKRWHCDGNANAMRTHSEGNAPITHNPLPITHNPEKRQQQRSRGSRLPLDWKPSELMNAWATKERPDLDITLTIEKFRDHWQAAAGSKGVKQDWEATFRNWVRSERSDPKKVTHDYSQVIANLKD